MLSITDAKKLIKQLQEEPILCSDKYMETEDFIVIKKSGSVSSTEVREFLKHPSVNIDLSAEEFIKAKRQMHVNFLREKSVSAYMNGKIESSGLKYRSPYMPFY